VRSLSTSSTATTTTALAATTALAEVNRALLEELLFKGSKVKEEGIVRLEDHILLCDVLESLLERQVLVLLLGRVEHVAEDQSGGDTTAVHVENENLALGILDLTEGLEEVGEVLADLKVLIILTSELLVLVVVLEGEDETLLRVAAVDDVSDALLLEERLVAVKLRKH
jgi:hypothetical protein